jgi:hypothetical protein
MRTTPTTRTTLPAADTLATITTIEWTPANAG